MTDSVTSATSGWRKSSYSAAGNCVEMAQLSDGNIGIRDSKHPQGAVVAFTRAEIQAFLEGAKAGEFDDLG